MKKTRSNATWAALTAKQTETLEQWLFEDKLSYKEVLERARKKFKYAGSKSSLQRFYHRLRQERWLKKFAESGSDAAQMGRVKVNVGGMMASGLKMLALHFFEEMRDGVEGFKDLPAMAKILLHNEANQIQRDENRIREQALELRRKALEFQEKRWQFDIIDEAETLVPELQKLKQAREDAKDPYAENKRINAIRIRLFGRHPSMEFHPENAEEEAAMEKAKAREEAEREERQQQMEAEAAARAKTPPVPPEPVHEVESAPTQADDLPPEEAHCAPNPHPSKLPDEKRFLTKIKRLEW